jgi:hypothetical protein
MFIRCSKANVGITKRARWNCFSLLVAESPNGRTESQRRPGQRPPSAVLAGALSLIPRHYTSPAPSLPLRAGSPAPVTTSPGSGLRRRATPPGQRARDGPTSQHGSDRPTSWWRWAPPWEHEPPPLGLQVQPPGADHGARSSPSPSPSPPSRPAGSGSGAARCSRRSGSRRPSARSPSLSPTSG